MREVLGGRWRPGPEHWGALFWGLAVAAWPLAWSLLLSPTFRALDAPMFGPMALLFVLVGGPVAALSAWLILRGRMAARASAVQWAMAWVLCPFLVTCAVWLAVSITGGLVMVLLSPTPWATVGPGEQLGNLAIAVLAIPISPGLTVAPLVFVELALLDLVTLPLLLAFRYLAARSPAGG